NQLPPLLAVFDFADPDLVTGQRPTTNVPAQALFLLNNPFVREQAERIAEMLLRNAPTDHERVRSMYRLLLCREPTEDDHRQTLRFVNEVAAGTAERQSAAWSQAVQAVLASTEFRSLE